MALKRYTFTIDEDDFADVIAQIEALPEKSAGLRDAVVTYFQGGPPEPAPDPVADAIQEQTAQLLTAIYHLADNLTITAAPASSSNGHKDPPAPESPYRLLTCEECGEAFRISNEDPDTPYCATCREVVGKCADCGQRFELGGNLAARYCPACDQAFMNSAEGRELISSLGGINWDNA